MKKLNKEHIKAVSDWMIENGLIDEAIIFCNEFSDDKFLANKVRYSFDRNEIIEEHRQALIIEVGAYKKKYEDLQYILNKPKHPSDNEYKLTKENAHLKLAIDQLNSVLEKKDNRISELEKENGILRIQNGLGSYGISAKEAGESLKITLEFDKLSQKVKNQKEYIKGLEKKIEGLNHNWFGNDVYTKKVDLVANKILHNDFESFYTELKRKTTQLKEDSKKRHSGLSTPNKRPSTPERPKYSPDVLKGINSIMKDFNYKKLHKIIKSVKKHTNENTHEINRLKEFTGLDHF